MNVGDRPIREPRSTLCAALLLTLVASLPALLAACGDDDPMEPPRDRTAPTLVAADPVDLATGVHLDTDIVFTFSEDLDPATVTILSMTLQGPAGLVAGSVSSSGPLVIFEPSRLLDEASLYTAFATTSIRDLAGNPLRANVSVEFTTVASAMAQNDVE